MKMLAQKKGDHADRAGRRAWKLLRMALLWARKGGVFKHRLMMELRVFPKFLKNHLGTTSASSATPSRPQINYFERELSFNKTPLFGLHRPQSMCFSIPCLNPPVVMQDEDDDHLFYYAYEGRRSFLTNAEHACEIELVEDGDDDDDLDLGTTLSEDDNAAAYADEAVDRKADEFIAKFYQQMKLQRQISYLQYNEVK